MSCPLPKKDLIFNLNQGLGYEERSLALYEEFLALLPAGEQLSDDEKHDKEVIERIASDERRHIDIVRRLIVIAEEYYIEPVS